MLYCENCGEIFPPSNLDGGRYCPACGADDEIVPAEKCGGCGQYFAPHEVQHGLCPACRAEAQAQYTAFWDDFPAAFQDYVLDADWHPAGL